MKGPDQYQMDDDLMDELGGTMDDFDAKKAHPVVIEISIHPGGKAEVQEEAKPEDEDMGMLPTPEELDELMKANE